MDDRFVMERKGRIEDLDRSIDVDYWQRLGPEAIFSAAWEMAVQAWKLKGRGADELPKDLDLWVEPTSENGARVFQALAHFGAPLAGVTPDDFSSEGLFYQMGSPPVRLDILTSVTGMRFEEAWPRRVERDLEGVRTPFISREDLIRIKSALGRPQDLMDVDALKKVPG